MPERQRGVHFGVFLRRSPVASKKIIIQVAFGLLTKCPGGYKMNTGF